MSQDVQDIGTDHIRSWNDGHLKSNTQPLEEQRRGSEFGPCECEESIRGEQTVAAVDGEHEGPGTVAQPVNAIRLLFADEVDEAVPRIAIGEAVDRDDALGEQVAERPRSGP